MKGILVIVVSLMMAVAGVGLAMLNTNPITVNFHYTTLELPLALLVGVCFAVGALLGMIVSSLLIVKLKRQIAKLRRTTEQVASGGIPLRAVPIKHS